MNKKELKQFLNEKALQYENPDFIPHDPIQIPHRFQLKEDIEIAAFLTATIAWGNRKSIITNAGKMMELMGQSPYDFVMSYEQGTAYFEGFVHRTFNAIDLETFQNVSICSCVGWYVMQQLVLILDYGNLSVRHS